MNRDLSVLEAAIGYSFNSKSLLKHALKHSSYTNEKHQHKNENNERLEFLGDAVLELVCSRFLFEKYPKLSILDYLLINHVYRISPVTY